MKEKIIPIGLFLLTASLSAQEVISSQGDSYSNGTHTLDYTIGEPVIETVSNGTNDLTQGFHQTNLVITKIEDVNIDLNVSIFPNPTSELVNLTMEDFLGFTINLFDISGKLLQQKVLTDNKTTVSLDVYPKGSYMLTLTNNDNKKIKTYQIIKQ